jgi:hypothetical protein
LTPVLGVPDTVAANCWVPPGWRVTIDAGFTSRETVWTNVIVARTLFVGSAMLVAVIVTLDTLLDAGAE